VISNTALEFTDYNFRDTFYRPLFIFNAYRQLLWYVYDIFMPFFFLSGKSSVNNLISLFEFHERKKIVWRRNFGWTVPLRVQLWCHCQENTYTPQAIGHLNASEKLNCYSCNFLTVHGFICYHSWSNLGTGWCPVRCKLQLSLLISHILPRQSQNHFTLHVTGGFVYELKHLTWSMQIRNRIVAYCVLKSQSL